MEAASGRIGELVELERRPGPLDRDPLELPVGVDDHRVADRFEERQVGVAVGVGGRCGQVESLLLRELADRGGLSFAVCAAERASGVDAVDDLAGRADRAVEAELARELLDDLLQRCRDDVDGLAALAVALDELERLPIDEGLQNRLHCGGHEVAKVVDAEPLQHHQAVLRRLAHRLGARAARGEEQLPGGGLGELAAPDDAVLAERAGERERARASQQRAVEVEEGSGLGHASSLEVVSRTSRSGAGSPSARTP